MYASLKMLFPASIPLLWFSCLFRCCPNKLTCVLFSSRMKYLWTPYVCMFTAFGVCSPDLWMTVFKWLKLKSIHPVLLVSAL